MAAPQTALATLKHDTTPDSPTGEVKEFIDRLRFLHDERAQQHELRRLEKKHRARLTDGDRDAVLAKTKGMCHICGGKVQPKRWHVDHLVPFSAGGEHSIGNYLPAHYLCNRYRWDIMGEEFQWTLKIGVWARTLMRKSAQPKRSTSNGSLGYQMAESFFQKEQGLGKRRKSGKIQQN